MQRNTRRLLISTRLLLLLVLVSALGSTLVARAQDPTPTPTETPTPQDTPTPTATNTPEPPTATSTATNTPVPPTPTATNTPEPPTPTQTPSGPTSALCQFTLTEAGDTDPFTYLFVNQSQTYDGYDWVVDGTVVSSATSIGSYLHTFSATGTYNVGLRCTMSDASFPPGAVDGSVTIASLAQASFNITPSSTGNPGHTIYTVNTSTGAGLSYQWSIFALDASNTPVMPALYTSNNANISYTFNAIGSYRVQLSATNASGTSVTFQDIAIVERAPRANFSISQTTGPAPLTVTVNGVPDADSGPITQWSWSMPGGEDGSGNAFTSASGQGPHTITYPATGTYTITLNYSNSAGFGSASKQVVVVANGAALIADFTRTSSSNVSGGVRVCFSNLSTGPVARSIWTFGDGSPSVTDNAGEVCHVYATGGTYTVRLRVENSSGSVTSNAQRAYTVVAAPVARFNSSRSSIIWGQTVTLDGSISDSPGIIDTYEWDLDGDGQFDDATGDVLTNVQIGNINGIRLGANLVGLRVTGPGGVSSVQQIITVDRREITCDISGTLTLLPNAGAQTYTASLTGLNGRTATYDWQILGTGINQRGSNSSITFNVPLREAAYRVILNATTADGASCSVEKTLGVAWPALVCTLSGPATAIPNGSSYSYTASVTTASLSGRTVTYRWFRMVGGVETEITPSPGTSLTTSWNGSAHNTNETFRVVMTPVEGGSPCQASQGVSIAFADLTCSLSGTLNPIPNGTGYTYSFAVPANLIQGRTITYRWFRTVGGVETEVTPSPGSSLSTSWLAAAHNTTETLRVVAEPNYGASCQATATLNIRFSALTCSIGGEPNPIPDGTSYDYSASVGSQQGRTLTYRWFRTVGGVETEVTPSPGSSLTTSWLAAAHNTTERLRLVVTPSTGTPCEATRDLNIAFPALACSLNGSTAPLPNGTSYDYDLTIDSSTVRGRTLTYQWYRIVGGVESLITPTSNVLLTTSWTTAAHKTTESLRVVVTPSTGTPCTRTLTMNISWPTLTCGLNSPTTTPRPTMPSDGGPLTYTWARTVSGASTRTLTYAWAVNGTGEGDGTTTSVSRSYDWTQVGQVDNFSFTVTANNGPGASPATESCTGTGTATVTMPALVCAPLSGDLTPVVGENASYTSGVNNVGRSDAFGRTITYLWDLQQWNSTSSAWEDVPGYTSYPIQNFNYRFDTPLARYRLRYTGSVIEPTQTCAAAWQEINVAATGADFTCDDGLFGPNTINNPSGSYSYEIEMDNTNGIHLAYTWSLLRRPASGPDVLVRVLGTSTTTTAFDGRHTSPTFTGAQFTPIGSYILRADVAQAAGSPVTTSYTCSKKIPLSVGTFSVDFTSTITSGSTITTGQQICLTNTSTTNMEGIDGLNYTWDFGAASNSLNAQTSTAQQPGCLSYSAEGNFTIRLTGSNAYGDRTAYREVTYRVLRPQSILIERTDDYFLAGNQYGFRVTGVNIDTYRWNILNPSGNQMNPRNTSGTTRSQIFGTPGRYRVQVEGTGPLGITNAELEVNVLGPDDIIAAFTPTQYAGIAPLDICFTDNSSSGRTLTNWWWDFGNGQTLAYDAASIPAQICTSYSVVGQDHAVVLRVRNAAGTEATATNTIRTYSAFESQSNFTVQPQGGSRYCFTAIVPVGTTVSGWTFGDGSPAASGQDTICHTFQTAGRFIVSMNIGDGVRTGRITRVVDVSPTSSGSPSLSIAASCAADRTITVTVSNTGAAMLTSDEINLTDSTNANTGRVSFRLDAGTPGAPATRSFTFANQSGSIRVTTVDSSLTTNTTCNYPPSISVVGVCEAGEVRFRITNASGPNVGPMHTGQNYTITAGSTTVSSGSFNLAAGTSDTVSLGTADPYLTYTFTSSGYAGTFTVSHSCGARPSLSIVSACANPVTFTITNNGGAMVRAQSLSVTGTGGTDVTPAPGTFQLTAGGSVTFSMTSLNPYPSYRLTSSGFAGTLDDTEDCGNPSLVATALCAVPGTFTVRNEGADMVSSQPFTVRDLSTTSDITASLTALNAGGTPFAGYTAGTLSLRASETLVLQITGRDPYAGYSFSSTGFAATLNRDLVCARPILDISSTCSPAEFVVTNNGGPMLTDHQFRLTSGDGRLITLAAGNTLKLNAGQSQAVSIPPGFSIYGASIEFDHLGVTAGHRNACVEPTPTPTPTPTPLPTRNGTALGIDGIGIPNWAAVPTCGHNCPTFRLYHTDEVGNWEIFRLDGADERTRTSVRENLTLSDPDKDYRDMAPSLSPNNEWIIFTSNRDKLEGEPENWELYVAPTSGGDPDAIVRVTYNEKALDTDPVWGPNNWVVFETNRNGNWDLYAIDMETGRTYQLTDNLADDINPFWSPDGQKLVFQSSRMGRWQIFELDLVTMTVRMLSDGQGIDVEPMYSNDGEHIAYRSYETEEANSRIAIMDKDGRNSRYITGPDESATNHTWSPSDSLIAYQSDKDGDLDVYVYQTRDGEVRQLTDNAIADYAPTWRCDDDTVIFTSDIEGNPDIYEEQARPILDPPVRVEEDADQLTFETDNDIYPQMTPPEENASREGRTSLGAFGEQTIYLEPLVDTIQPDISFDGIERDDWAEVEGCPPPPDA